MLKYPNFFERERSELFSKHDLNFLRVLSIVFFSNFGFVLEFNVCGSRAVLFPRIISPLFLLNDSAVSFNHKFII